MLSPGTQGLCHLPATARPSPPAAKLLGMSCCAMSEQGEWPRMSFSSLTQCLAWPQAHIPAGLSPRGLEGPSEPTAKLLARPNGRSDKKGSSVCKPENKHKNFRMPGKLHNTSIFNLKEKERENKKEKKKK